MAAIRRSLRLMHALETEISISSRIHGRSCLYRPNSMANFSASSAGRSSPDRIRFRRRFLQYSRYGVDAMRTNMMLASGSNGPPALVNRRRLSTSAPATSTTSHVLHVLRVPPLGESIREGTVMEWRKRVGSVVQAEEVVCVLETEKVSVDIHSDIPGRLVSVAVEVGGTAFVGGDLAVIEALSAESASADTAGTAPIQTTELIGRLEAGSERNESSSLTVYPTSSERINSSVSTISNPNSRRIRKPLILFGSISRRQKAGLSCNHLQQMSPSSRVQVTEAASSCSHVSQHKRSQLYGEGNIKKQSAIHNCISIQYDRFEELPAFLQRHPLSEEEISSVNNGGPENIDAEVQAWSTSLSFQPCVSAGLGPLQKVKPLVK